MATANPSEQPKNVPSEAPSVPASKPCCPWATALGLAALILYAAILLAITLDQLLGFGWFPSRLERQVRSDVEKLARPESQAEAFERLRNGEAFVVIPELVRELDHASPELRSAAARLLSELTKDSLKGDLLGYDPSSQSTARKESQRKWREWWKTVEEHY